MPFNWRDFLVLAHELQNDQRESVQRTCLGRTYYYVYNLGLTNAQRLKFSSQSIVGKGSHRQLWDWFENRSDPAFKQMGIFGKRIYSKRIDADYKDRPIPNLGREVQRQIREAQNFEVLIAKSNNQTPPTPLV